MGEGAGPSRRLTGTGKGHARTRGRGRGYGGGWRRRRGDEVQYSRLHRLRQGAHVHRELHTPLLLARIPWRFSAGQADRRRGVVRVEERGGVTLYIAMPASMHSLGAPSTPRNQKWRGGAF